MSGIAGHTCAGRADGLVDRESYILNLLIGHRYHLFVSEPNLSMWHNHGPHISELEIE